MIHDDLIAQGEMEIMRSWMVEMRVLIVDDEPRVRSALRLLLEQQPEITIVGEAADVRSLLAIAKATAPDVVLLDWEMPGKERAAVLAALRELDPAPQVVGLTSGPESSCPVDASRPEGFVSKCQPPEALLAALAVRQGGFRVMGMADEQTTGLSGAAFATR